ncbi:MAG: metallophosphatase family protein [Flavobacteriaceae bacterium]|nr:metallophosphatase family protein [Flavobacteriaceae bacterium]
MKRILLLSDTHSHLDDRIIKYIHTVDEVWHAGDIGDLQVTDSIQQLKPLKAVYGNIDDHIARSQFPQDLLFQCEGVLVWMTHIGGYPGNYQARIKPLLQKHRPKLYICGHSHILKVQYDKKLDLLHLNPGACGKHGFHQVRTMLRFTIEKENIKDMEIIEMKR